MEKTRQVAKEVQSLCQSMSNSQRSLMLDMMGRVGGRWSLYVLFTLAISGEPMRFFGLIKRLNGISDKMLSQTLRLLEEDGLVTRKAFYEQVPPRVEYELTPLGREFVQATTPLWKWMHACISQFEDARQSFASSRVAALMFIFYSLVSNAGLMIPALVGQV